MALTSITKDFVVRSGALTEGTAFVSSSTGQTATLQVNGGAAIAKNLIVGTTATIWGNSTLVGTLQVGGYSTLGMVTATVFTATSANILGNELVGGLFTATGAATLGNILTVAGNSLFNGAVNTFSGALFVTGTNITALGGALTVDGKTLLNNTTTAIVAGGGDGSLKTLGGVYVGDNLIVASPASSTSTADANALYVVGGAHIGNTFVVQGVATFNGNVIFNGTSTNVYSTNTVYTDNLINIHVPPGSTGTDHTWTLDDGKDIGFGFHYYKTVDKNAFLGLSNDSGYLEWYEDGYETTTGVHTSGTYGTFKTANILLTGTADASSTITGAFQVVGGAGIGGTVYAGFLAAANLTTASGIVYSVNNKLQNTPVTWNNTTQRLVGTIDRANTATNVQGGAAGSLIYQTGESQTTTLPIGTNGYILQVTGGNPTWSPVSGLTAGLASTATNIAGGLKDQIPYQSGPGQTVFNAGMTFNGTTFTATNVVVSGTGNSTGYNNGTGALQVKGGAAINNDLWVGGDINLQGSLFLKGVGLDQITGSTGTFDFLIVEGTGTSLTVGDGSTFAGITTVTNATPALGAAGTAALQVRGGVGIAKDIYVGTTATVAGAASVGTSLTVTGFSGLNGGVTASALTVTNAATVGTTLGVTGYTTLSGGVTASALTVTNAATVGTTLGVTGYTTLSGGATISAATVTNNLLVSGNETVTGFTSLNGGATASALTVTNAATVGTTLGVTGYSSLNGGATISAATVTNSLAVGTSLTVTGFAALNGGASATAMTITNSTAVATTGTGALTIPFGGVGIGGGLVVGGITTTTNTLPALGAAGVASVQVLGGVGIAKDLYVGTTATVAGTLFATSTAPALGGGANQAAVEVAGGIDIAKDLYVGTTATVSGITFHNNTTPSLGSATAGAIQTTGGVGIAKDLYVGTTGTFGTSVTAPNFYGNFNGVITGSATKIDTVANYSASGAYYPTFVSANNASASSMTVYTTSSLTITPATGAVSIAGNLTVTSAGTTALQNTTDSNATNNGALVISGGVGIAKSVTIGQTLTVGSASSSTTVNSLYSNNYLISSFTSGFITTNSLINLDTFSSTAYRTAKYIIQIVDTGTVPPKVHTEEIMLFHDGSNVYMTEYGISTNLGELGTFDSTIGAGTVTLNFQANYTPTSMTVKTMRTAITL